MGCDRMELKIMNKNKSVRFAACAAFVLAASETLRAAELTRRWSFNGDYSDSAGGADAVKCGTYVSLYGGRVHMGCGACSHQALLISSRSSLRREG